MTARRWRPPTSPSDAIGAAISAVEREAEGWRRVAVHQPEADRAELMELVHRHARLAILLGLAREEADRLARGLNHEGS